VRAFLLREGDRTRVVTPYVPEFVEDLKAEIPYYAKQFDRESKHWVVDGEYEDTALEIASRYFEAIVVVPEAEALRREQAARMSARPSPQQAPHGSDVCVRVVRTVWQEEAELYLLPGAPYAVIQAAYRALAKTLHPDVSKATDATAIMVRLNRAYETLTRRHRAATA
jgi:hypothetical protein